MQITAGIQIAVLKKGHPVEAWLKIWPLSFSPRQVYLLFETNIIISEPTLTFHTYRGLLETVYVTGPVKKPDLSQMAAHLGPRK